jgi:hypothetical protein
VGKNFGRFAWSKGKSPAKSRRAKWIWNVGSRRTRGEDHACLEERYSGRKQEQSGRIPEERELKQSWTSIGTGHVALDQRFVDSLIRRNRGRRGETSRRPKTEDNQGHWLQRGYVA